MVCHPALSGWKACHNGANMAPQTAAWLTLILITQLCMANCVRVFALLIKTAQSFTDTP